MKDLSEIKKEIIEFLSSHQLTVTTAESCTGGLIASEITSVPGASECYAEGYITYAAYSKMKLLGVTPDIISEKGVVSPECAEAMAKGALKQAGADYSVVSTGIAGPGGGDEEHPVGLVYLACADRDSVTVEKNIFSGDRQEVQHKAAERAINMLYEKLKDRTLKVCIK